jgi:hypothetical protein
MVRCWRESTPRLPNNLSLRNYNRVVYDTLSSDIQMRKRSRAEIKFNPKCRKFLRKNQLFPLPERAGPAMVAAWFLPFSSRLESL